MPNPQINILHEEMYEFCCDTMVSHVDTPNVGETANDAAVPVLSANVGLFGALTLTAIVVAVIVGVCVYRYKKTKGRKFLNT